MITIRPFKRCPRCATTKPATTEFWHRSPAPPQFCGAHCRDCRNKTSTRKPQGRSLDERIASKLIKTDSCWLWTGARHKAGYGIIGIGGRPKGMHRVMWELCRGKIPRGTFVCHNCPGGDNPLCCNPDHMFLGTQADNMRDAKAKSRMRQGEAHRFSVLTADSVREARHLHAAGASFESLGERFGVAGRTVADACRRKTWRSVV